MTLAGLSPDLSSELYGICSRTSLYQSDDLFSSTGISFSSSTCPYFFSNLLEDPEFLDCKPLSLLLTTSSGLFAAQENATTVLSYVIDQTCKAPSTCERKMQALAEEIQKDKICGKDIQDQNQVLVSRPAYLRKVMNAEGHVGYRAQTALDGFRTYTMMREAACLKDETTDHYCMAESANNPDSSAMYWWYIGVGESLPDDTTPSCNDCEKQLMSVYRYGLTITPFIKASDARMIVTVTTPVTATCPFLAPIKQQPN